MSRVMALYRLYRPQVLFVLGTFFFLFLVMTAVKRQLMELMGLPVVLIVVLMALENFRNIWFLAVFCVPLSFSTDGLLPGAGLTFPTDLLSLGLMVLVLFKMVSERKGFLRFYNHPIFWAICAWFIWMLFTVVASEMPGVSAKFMANYLWTVMAFYFLGVLVMRNTSNALNFVMLIGIAFALAFWAVMALYVGSGRNPFGLRFNPMPFFSDHTVFGAFTAMYVPIFYLIAFHGKQNRAFRFISFMLFSFILMGLFFSYSRGAWVSAAAGLVFCWVILLWGYIKRLWMPIAFILVAALGFFLYTADDSGGKTDAVSRKNLVDHVLSVQNWKTDDSNAERINRWKSALQMYSDRPHFGWGPGTYAMIYPDYQKAVDRTGISTNHSDNGTAHNEFLLAQSEMGWMGLLTTFVLFTLPIFYGLRGYFIARDPNIRILYLGTALGLVVYFLHAFVNNFLDQDKVGASFFGFLAIITALDIFYLRKKRFQRLGKEAYRHRLD